MFTHEGELYRQVNRCFENDYSHFLDSSLYAKFVADGLLVEHEEVSLDLALTEDAVRVLRPRKIPFVSYPYEWAFSALKDAALLTLRLQRIALDHGMTLKDASAYNILFEGSRPLFIDTLSFERYRQGAPWDAYSQFCRHFLTPLLLMSRCDLRLGQMLRVHLDGIPLDLTKSLLSLRTWIRPGHFIHVYLHDLLQRRHAHPPGGNTPRAKGRSVSLRGLLGIIDSLQRTVERLVPRSEETNWTAYYEDNSYQADSFRAKEEIVGRYLDRIAPRTVWDLGANTGHFSSLACEKGIQTMAFDSDPACVERIYVGARAKHSSVLPLVMDLANPSSGAGWDNRERKSLKQRGPVDAVLALALIHHLVISNNTPLAHVARVLHGLCHHLIIEFVPKDDVQVQKMLKSRRDIFDDYTIEQFESVFKREFDLLEHDRISGGASGRTLYLMRRK